MTLVLNADLNPNDHRIAESAAWLSLITYYPERKAKKLIGERLKVPLEAIDYRHLPTRKTDTNFYLFHTDDTIVLSFRGSEPSSFRDWITTDLDHELVSAFGIGNSKVKVHNGFFTAMNSIWSEVHDLILARWKMLVDLNNKEPRILITGHSLGGALANMTAATFARFVELENSEHHDTNRAILANLCIHTFGQPRIGDKDFRKWYNSFEVLENNTFRHVNDRDLIPRIPPRERNVWFRFFDPDWIHVGHQWHYSKSGKVDKDVFHKDVLDLFYFDHIPNPKALYRSVLDHMPWRYVWAAEGLVSGEPKMSRPIEEMGYLAKFFKMSLKQLVKVHFENKKVTALKAGHQSMI